MIWQASRELGSGWGSSSIFIISSSRGGYRRGSHSSATATWQLAQSAAPPQMP